MADKSPIMAVAPMMEWTHRHARQFYRSLSNKALLYTEMVTTGALIHGDVERHLRFDVAEHPVILQLGGSDPKDLAASARLAQDWGYDGVDLNCGCPSDQGFSQARLVPVLCRSQSMLRIVCVPCVMR